MSIRKFGQINNMNWGYTRLFGKITGFVYPKRLIYPKITFIALWTSWLVSLILGPGNFDLAGQAIGTDYIQFYTAGLTLRTGDSSQLYNFDYQFSLEKAIIGPELTNYHAFITPPLYAVLYIPFSLFPYLLSFILWCIFSLILLYLSIFLIQRNNTQKYFFWSLVWFPVFASVSFGQNSLLSLTILSMVFVSWSRNKYLTSGLTASLLFYKPQLLIGVFILWILEFRTQRKALAGLAIGLISILSLNILLFPEASIAYIKFAYSELPSMISDKQFPIWHMHTIRGFWHILFDGFRGVADLLYILSLIPISYGFFRFFKFTKGERKILFAGVICFTLLITPHAMIYDWSILLLSAMLFWNNRNFTKALLIPIFTMMWLGALISGPLSYFQLNYMPVGIQISIPIFFLSCISIYCYISRVHPLDLKHSIV